MLRILHCWLKDWPCIGYVVFQPTPKPLCLVVTVQDATFTISHLESKWKWVQNERQRKKSSLLRFYRYWGVTIPPSADLDKWNNSPRFQGLGCPRQHWGALVRSRYLQFLWSTADTPPLSAPEFRIVLDKNLLWTKVSIWMIFIIDGHIHCQGEKRASSESWRQVGASPPRFE